MNPTAERIYRDTYERHVARLRAYIEADGICNALGALIDAIEANNKNTLDDNLIYDQKTETYKNNMHAAYILDIVRSALDIDYKKAKEGDRQKSIYDLITDLNLL